MDEIIFTDKNKMPTEEMIFLQIGKRKIYWESFFKYIHTNHPEFSEQWNYYNDGKRWLMKITRKSKTVFWLSVIKNSFQITFYFGDKAEPAIMESTISDTIKREFKEGKRFGKIRGITLMMNNKQNVEFGKELITIKLKY